MKFIHLSLILALGTTPALFGSGSSAKKRKSGVYKANDPLREDGSDAKKARTSSASASASASAASDADTKAKAQATQELRALIAEKSDGGYKVLNWQRFFTKVQTIVEQGPDLSVTAGAKGDTIMHVAAGINIASIITYLKGKAPQLVVALNNRNETPLQVAFKYENRKQKVQLQDETVRMLADKSVINNRDADGNTTLSIALNKLMPAKAQMLIDVGATITQQDLECYEKQLADIKYAWHFAGRPNSIRLRESMKNARVTLAAKGGGAGSEPEVKAASASSSASASAAAAAAPMVVDSEPAKAPAAAASSSASASASASVNAPPKRMVGVRAFLETVDEEDHDYNTEHFAKNFNELMLNNKEGILTTGGSDQDTLLGAIACYGTVQDAKRLQAANPEQFKKLINACNAKGESPLYMYLAYANKPNLEMVNFLVASGADVNARADDDGRRPLHWAVQGGHLAIVRYLLAQGAQNRHVDKEVHRPSMLIDNISEASTREWMKDIFDGHKSPVADDQSPAAAASSSASASAGARKSLRRLHRLDHDGDVEMVSAPVRPAPAAPDVDADDDEADDNFLMVGSKPDSLPAPSASAAAAAPQASGDKPEKREKAPPAAEVKAKAAEQAMVMAALPDPVPASAQAAAAAAPQVVEQDKKAQGADVVMAPVDMDFANPFLQVVLDEYPKSTVAACINELRNILPLNPDLSLETAEGSTLVHYAVESCSRDLIELLKEHNPAVLKSLFMAHNKRGVSPAMLLLNAVTPQSDEFKQWLTAQGIDISAHITPDMALTNVAKSKKWQELFGQFYLAGKYDGMQPPVGQRITQTMGQPGLAYFATIMRQRLQQSSSNASK